MAIEMFGPYRLERLLGRGGMGEVYRAYDTVRERTVALKRLAPHLGATAEYRARFRREALLTAQLSSPHVIPIHDFGEMEQRLFIDMRLVDGADLATLLTEQGPLPPARAVAIIAQVASALDAAHAEGLIHRDVKPSNILLRDHHGEDFVYLIDFGIAANVLATTLTPTGMMIGTAAYMAPERFTHRNGGDHLVDIYALGCVLHETLSGQPPYPGNDFPQLMYAHLHTPPPRPSTQRSGIPAALDEVVVRGMAKRPDRRHASAGDLARAAGAALTPAPRVLSPQPAGSVASEGSPASHLRSRRLFYGIFAVLGVVLLISTIGIVTAERQDPVVTPSLGLAPPADPRAQMVAAVRHYYNIVIGDNAAGWARLGPTLQSQAGGFAPYQSFWSVIADARVIEATAVDDDTVRATVLFAARNRAPTEEVHDLDMLRAPDDSWLIDADHQVH